jgi:hypothetical protein
MPAGVAGTLNIYWKQRMVDGWVAVLLFYRRVTTRNFAS